MMFNELPALTKKNILVFYFSLNGLIKNIASFRDLLSQDEQEKAQRFFFEKDKDQYTLARGVLRVLLGHYTNVMPPRITFSYHAHGKPYLKDFPSIQFNVSHSKEMVMLALNYEDPLGVDIECMQRKIDVDGISKSFFNDKEHSRLLGLSGINKKRLFFYQWAAKEAFVKAIGRGLSFSLKNIEIAFNTKEELEIATLHDSSENPANWILHALGFIPKYVAVLATKAQSKVLVVRNLGTSLAQP